MTKIESKPAKKPKKTSDQQPAEPTPDMQTVRVPPGAAVWGLKKEVDGGFERCRFYQGGQALDRWSIDTVPTIDRIGRTWGRGRYKLLWFTADFQNKGVSRQILIDDPSLPPGSPYPNKPPEASTPASSAKPEPTLSGSDRMTKILQIAEGKLGPAATVAVLFQLLEEGNSRHIDEANRRAEEEVRRARERARIEREEDEARHRRQLEEDDARWRRRLAEEESRRTRAEEDGGGSELEILREEIAELKDGGGEKGNLLAEKLAGLIDTVTPHLPAAGRFLWAAIGEQAAKKGEGTK